MPLPLSGLRVVVTGDVPGLDRDAAQDAVRALGGTVASSVSATTDLLVVGPRAGAAKLAKAAELRLLVLPAQDLAALAQDPGAWDGQPLGTPAGEPERADEPDLPPQREAAEPTTAHPAGTTSYSRDGRWTVVMTCACGHRAEGADRAEAAAGHRAHRVAVGDLDG